MKNSKEFESTTFSSKKIALSQKTDQFGLHGCQKEPKDVVYKLLRDFFVAHEMWAVKNFLVHTDVISWSSLNLDEKALFL